MCLLIDKGINSRVRKSLRGGKVRFWKVYELRTSYEADVFLHNKFRNPLSPVRFSDRGYSHSNRAEMNLTNELSENEKRQETVYYGIHVFVNKEDVIDYIKSKEDNDCAARLVSIPVYVDKKDFVAAGEGLGYENAVFMKIRVKREDLKKINAKNFSLNRKKN